MSSADKLNVQEPNCPYLFIDTKTFEAFCKATDWGVFVDKAGIGHQRHARVYASLIDHCESAEHVKCSMFQRRQVHEKWI